MSDQPLVLRQRDARGVVTLTLNRPEAFNALSEACSTRCRPRCTAVADDRRRAWSSSAPPARPSAPATT
jgi:enoyl-CoA hydratase/carnithine racemase